MAAAAGWREGSARAAVVALGPAAAPARELPMIAILAAWRYGFRRQPLEYDPLYWGAVFPLGMYAVATLRMADAMALGFLDFILHVFFWLGLGARLLAFVGMAKRRAKTLASRRPGET
jgi:tellurite resistance protein TehA-like permease